MASSLQGNRVSYCWRDLSPSFVACLAERTTISEQTIRALAIRSPANQAVIRALEDQSVHEGLPAHGQRNGQSGEQANSVAPPCSFETNAGSAWIRTRNRRIGPRSVSRSRMTAELVATGRIESAKPTLIGGADYRLWGDRDIWRLERVKARIYRKCRGKMKGKRKSIDRNQHARSVEFSKICRGPANGGFGTRTARGR